MDLEQVPKNLELVQARIRARTERLVRTVAATKYVRADDLQVLLEAGVKIVGENRADSLEEKWSRYGEELEFHFIGHLQRRKARKVVPLVTMIHSVDSLELVRELDARTERPIEVLLQVNVSGEESKYGILPADAHVFLEQAAAFERVRFAGLMTMAPLVDDPEEVRPVFRRLRELRDELATSFVSRYALDELSMGMSNDFEVAVEEGATIVRLGSILFSRA